VRTEEGGHRAKEGLNDPNAYGLPSDRGSCPIARQAVVGAWLFGTVRTSPITSYEAGVPLPYIRDILGHVDLSTTEIYARASTEAKRKALEAAYPNVVTDDLPEWNPDCSTG
jgi:integrase